MVNEFTEKKSAIINILRNTTGYVSGEELADKLSVSRVAVWKTIKALQELGYHIESGHSGYQLEGCPDKPLPWELGMPAEKIKYFNSLDSTMHKAADMAGRGGSGGTTIIAGKQNEGVNRDGRRWQSPAGGLYLTRIRTEPLPAALAGFYTLSVCAAAAETINRLYGGAGFETMIEWPSALTARGKRIGGVLTEFSGQIGTLSGINTGIGINVNTARGDLPKGADSMAELTGSPCSEKFLASELISALDANDKQFSAEGFLHSAEDIIRRCSSLIACIGKKVRVTREKTELTGIAAGISETGVLIITEPGGNEIPVYLGEKIQYE